MSEREEFYAEGEIPQQETERLRTLEYPSVVSQELLDNFNLEGKRVLDAGAGANADLLKYVGERGGMYVPMDIQSVMLEKQREGADDGTKPYFGVLGSVKQLPFQDESVDFFHQRFVLMNIDPESRQQDVKEAYRVAKESVLLLEYNWDTFASDTDQPVVDEVREAAFEFFSRFATDPHMGTKMSALVESALPGATYELKSFLRKQGPEHMKELLPLINTFHQVSEHRLQDKSLADRFAQLSQSLTENPISFVPPEIVAAVIRK